VIGEDDVQCLAVAARELPPAEGATVEDDFVLNLFETVLDYMLQTTVVVKALEHYKAHRWDEIRTLDDLDAVLARYDADQEGNTDLALYLWGYKLWTRAEQLRGLARHFRAVGVADQDTLRRWAETSTFKADFEGKVKGLGLAVYQALVMRQGVDTVKPDVHVRRFAEAAVGRRLNDPEVVELVTEAAARLGLRAVELDWRIWEASQSGGLLYPVAKD
jgi:hypothetical protein